MKEANAMTLKMAHDSCLMYDPILIHDGFPLARASLGKHVSECCSVSGARVQGRAVTTMGCAPLCQSAGIVGVGY